MPPKKNPKPVPTSTPEEAQATPSQEATPGAEPEGTPEANPSETPTLPPEEPPAPPPTLGGIPPQAMADLQAQAVAIDAPVAPPPPEDPMQAQIRAMEAAKARIHPWVTILAQKAQAGDPLAYDLLTDMSHCAAQLTRYIADELSRAGHTSIAMAAYHPDTFGEICATFLHQPMSLIMENPGPAYWMDYMSGLVVTDLRDREERVAAHQETMAKMRAQAGAPPQQPAQAQKQPQPQIPPRFGRKSTPLGV